MDTRHHTENTVIAILAIVILLFFWGALQATCALVVKSESLKQQQAVPTMQKLAGQGRAPVLKTSAFKTFAAKKQS